MKKLYIALVALSVMSATHVVQAMQQGASSASSTVAVDLAALRQRHTALVSQTSDASTHVANLIAELKALRAQAKNDKETAAQRIAQLEGQLTTATTSLEQVRKDLEDTKTSLADVASERESLANTLAQERAASSKQLTDLQDELATLRQEITQHTTDIRGLLQLLSEAHTHIGSLQSQLDAIAGEAQQAVTHA